MGADHTYATLIVGAGFTGLGTAIRLAEAGVSDIVLLERADRVGGTWRDTTYPGASCDVPSLLYSYSFVKNPTWSRTYSPAPEIYRHLEDMATKFDIRRHIRFKHEVSDLTFDEDAGVWTAKTKNRKRFKARTVVLASGPLSDVSFPGIRGLDSYRGHKIHSARWDHDYDFAGKRVAVIGTGASAIQIVPELVKQAGFVKVFQRTPAGCCPAWISRPRRRYRPCSPKFLPFNNLPAKRCSGDTRPVPRLWYGTPRSPRWWLDSARPICAPRSPTRGCAGS